VLTGADTCVHKFCSVC